MVDVSSDQQNKGLQASLVIDRPTASRLGITPQLIDNILYDAFGQRQVSITYTQLNQYHAIMEVAPFWQHPETLRDIYVEHQRGMVPLSTFTYYEPTSTSLSVAHQAQFPLSRFRSTGSRDALGDAVTAVETAKQRWDSRSIRGSSGNCPGVSGLAGQ